jgi:hypothetical protein
MKSYCYDPSSLLDDMTNIQVLRMRLVCGFQVFRFSVPEFSVKTDFMCVASSIPRYSQIRAQNPTNPTSVALNPV